MKQLILLLVLVASVSGQTPEIAPNENLVADGIPKIPAALATAVAPYTQGREADFLSWHPVRRELLIATFFGDVPQIHQVKFPGAARTQLTFFEERPTRGVSYQPIKGDYFIFSKDIGGNENYQNYRYDLDTHKITLLTDGKSKNSPGIWSHTGNRIAYTSTRRTGKDTDIYIEDPLDPQSEHMAAAVEGGGWQILDWSPDDRKLLLKEVISINESYLWTLSLSDGEKSLITPKGGPNKVYYANARFRKDGAGIYVVSDRNSEFNQLAFLSLKTNDYTLLTRKFDWDVTEFDVSPDGSSLAVVTNEAGFTVLHVLDALTGRESRWTSGPTAITGVTGVGWHKNSTDLGFNQDSAKANTDVYSLNIETGKIDRWTYSEARVDMSQSVEPQLVKWKSFDDRVITGFLYRPPTRFNGKRPVIIDIHGGPEGQFQPYPLGLQNYFLNELGVALLFPNIRGSSGYGKSFLKLDNGLLRENAYKDIGALLDWIKLQSNLDADRIMVTGVSYGGHMTLITAARYSDRIRCALDIVGPSNLVTFLERTADYRRDLRRVEYGDERDPKVRAFLEETAPLNNASRIRKPLFVVQGKNDPRTSVAESEQIVQAVRKNNVPVWYLLGKNEGHGFSNKANRDFVFYATVEFVKEYLIQ
jgi:Tol biopolymer transport system component/dienelactone hydrolase